LLLARRRLSEALVLALALNLLVGEERLLVERLLVERLLVERLLVERLLVERLLVERLLVVRAGSSSSTSAAGDTAFLSVAASTPMARVGAYLATSRSTSSGVKSHCVVERSNG
jgi:hypothetical protein